MYKGCVTVTKAIMTVEAAGCGMGQVAMSNKESTLPVTGCLEILKGIVCILI